MAAKQLDNRVFVGGLSWTVTERQLEDAFRRFGKIINCEIMVERDTGRSRGFGFLTFSDRRGVDDAIREMHGRELGDRVISVNKAEPRPGESAVKPYREGYSSGARAGYSSNKPAPRDDECFKCGRSGHWARECPSGGSGGRDGGRFAAAPFSAPPSRLVEDRTGGYDDRFVDRNQYLLDRYDGGRYGDRDRFDGRVPYEVRDQFAADRLPPGGDRYPPVDKFRGPDRYPAPYEKDSSYERVAGPRRGSSERYGGGGGPTRHVGRSFADRPGPYDRTGRGGRPPSYDRY